MDGMGDFLFYTPLGAFIWDYNTPHAVRYERDKGFD
jgi:hypothetical protein